MKVFIQFKEITDKLSSKNSVFLETDHLMYIYFPISGCEAQLVSINRHFSKGWRDMKPGIMFCISLKRFIPMWFSLGHNVRKWVLSSTSELHNWQILSLRGIFGFLYRPISSSKGRHPHLISAIVLLLFREMVFRMYSSGLGQDLYSLYRASLPPLSESVGCLWRSSNQSWNFAVATVSHSTRPGAWVMPVTPTSLISLWVLLVPKPKQWGTF